MSTATQPTPQPEHPKVVVRELQKDEFWKLRYVPPFRLEGIPLFPGACRVVIAEKEDAGEIVGMWTLFDAIHVEPLWIAEGYRRRPGMGRRLWRMVRNILVSVKAPGAFACILKQDEPLNGDMAKRLGFTKLDGSLYYLRVKENDYEH